MAEPPDRSCSRPARPTYVPFGHVSPSQLNLAPGQSAQVTLHVSTPSTPGDAAGSIVLDSGDSQTTIPVTLRSLIPSGPQSFSATLTGGNGRSIITGEMFTYHLDVAAGSQELNASVELADNPNNIFQAWLVDPEGEAVAFAANQFPANNAAGYVNELGAQLHALNPAAGQWSLVILFAPAVSGTAISEPFTVSTDEAADNAASGWLPNSPHARLTAGQSFTYSIRVHNRGNAPEAYYLDARQPVPTNIALAAQNTATMTVPASAFNPVPVYLVPTNTTSFTAGASTTGTEPIQFDTGSPAGDPDIGSSQGLNVSAAFAADPISQGLWDVAADVVGPFGDCRGHNRDGDHVDVGDDGRVRLDGELTDGRPVARERRSEHVGRVQPGHRRARAVGNDPGDDHPERSLRHDRCRHAVPG